MKNKLNCIMLIDDDDDDNYFHQIVINKMNITEHIEVALNGEEALIFLKKENHIHPDIIFLDINMPKMNGWEFMEAYKELRANQKAKVVVMMLTTSENPEDKKRSALYPEITSFNSKPLTEEMLAAILEKHFSQTN
jgi:CheY-like chemotaxis protein